MNREYYAYGVCGILTLKAVILPDWPTTVALLFGASLCAFVMFLDFSKEKNKKDDALEGVKSEVAKVSDRLSKLSLKIGLK